MSGVESPVPFAAPLRNAGRSAVRRPLNKAHDQNLNDDDPQEHAYGIDRRVRHGRMIAGDRVVGIVQRHRVGHAAAHDAGYLSEIEFEEPQRQGGYDNDGDEREEESQSDPEHSFGAHDRFDEMGARFEPQAGQIERQSQCPEHQVGAQRGVGDDVDAGAEGPDQDAEDDRAACESQFDGEADTRYRERDASQQQAQEQTDENRNQVGFVELFDGIADIFFGSMIDKTHSKLGKARPWMLYGYIGCAITLVGIFAIPMGMSEFAKYAWFFICYTLLNSVFYTANNIAYSALTALVTKNSKERVQMGSYRFIFAFGTSLLIQAVTFQFVEAMGGGANGWRTVAIIYAVIGLIVNTISALSVKELSDKELADNETKTEETRYSFGEAFKILVHNKYYVMITVTYILQQFYGAMIGVGTYYAKYVLADENMFGTFAWFINIPLIIALIFTPTIVQKWNGMYKLNKYSYMVATVGRLLVAVAGYMGNIPLMLAFTALAALGQGPWQGDMNAVIASCSEYSWLTKHKHVDGIMYSCTSLGVKIGGGLGTAIVGLLLDFSGFKGTLTVQPDSAINMLHIMYLIVPFALDLIITFILSKMNVEKANAEIKEKLGISENEVVMESQN